MCSQYIGAFWCVLLFSCLHIVLTYAKGDGEDPAKESKCNAFNSSCDACSSHLECYWCSNDGSCHYYGWNRISTYFEHCTWGQARWKYCWLNVQAMVICLSILGGVLLISCCCCVCWCNNKCRRRKRRRAMRDQTEMDEQEEERRERQQIRSEERRSKMDQIRDKYGLNRNTQSSDQGPSYDRM